MNNCRDCAYFQSFLEENSKKFEYCCYNEKELDDYEPCADFEILAFPQEKLKKLKKGHNTVQELAEYFNTTPENFTRNKKRYLERLKGEYEFEPVNSKLGGIWVFKGL